MINSMNIIYSDNILYIKTEILQVYLTSKIEDEQELRFKEMKNSTNDKTKKRQSQNKVKGNQIKVITRAKTKLKILRVKANRKRTAMQ